MTERRSNWAAAYNWHLKTFDGREKSILRAATRKLLPNSIVERQKNPYPSTQDPGEKGKNKGERPNRNGDGHLTKQLTLITYYYEHQSYHHQW
jgi:asparagine synthetase B (glutamine-hydrolysing)